jgi:hypothetical protein
MKVQSTQLKLIGYLLIDFWIRFDISSPRMLYLLLAGRNVVETSNAWFLSVFENLEVGMPTCDSLVDDAEIEHTRG